MVNLKGFRFNLWELGGALGDLGTLLPLALALIFLNHLNPVALMAGAGLFYIAAGLYFRIPMPVQPLKAVSAIAIASGLGPGLIAAAGILMGGILLLLALTGLIRWLARIFAHPVIRGVQLSIGLILFQRGLELILGPGKPLLPVIPFLPWGILAALGGGAILCLLLRWRFLPASLGLLVYGVALTFLFRLGPPLDGPAVSTSLQPLPRWGDFRTAFFLLVLAQLPLTLGNAVLATAETARQYFGDGARRATPRALALSMGIANLGLGLVGGAPLCHGSGGLTAHYRFGARTGGASLLMGGICLALAAAFAWGMLPLLGWVPYSVLGVFLAFIGLQHAFLARDLGGGQALIAASMAGLSVLTGNLAWGFALGLVLYHSPRGLAWLRRSRTATAL